MGSQAPKKLYCVASDNTSGMCEESLKTYVQANTTYEPSYGDDQFTAEAADGFRKLFGTDCDVYFVFNGTAANSLALAALCQSYHSVIACENAHVETDECGAPEFFSNGTKLLLARGRNGKLCVDELHTIATKRRDIHYPKPKVVSVSMSTEMGTVYSVDELKAITTAAQQHGLAVHMDGARFANAVASLGVEPADITWKAGVDVLCFGGSKNGIGLSEAVIFFNRAFAEEFAYRCKQAGQLASKMRFMAAPWAASLQSSSWLNNAKHANACARRLSNAIAAMPGVTILYDTDANAVFVEMSEAMHAGLQALGWMYYRFIGGGARFMCSWRTSDEEVDALIRDLQAVVASKHT